MTKYTTLDIHQAIDLVKAGCKDVRIEIYHHSYSFELPQKLKMSIEDFFNAQYRINTQALEEFNKCTFCDGTGEDEWNDRLCPECRGTGEVK